MDSHDYDTRGKLLGLCLSGLPGSNLCFQDHESDAIDNGPRIARDHRERLSQDKFAQGGRLVHKDPAIAVAT